MFMKIMAFWGVMPLECTLLDIHQHFGGTCCLIFKLEE